MCTPVEAEARRLLGAVITSDMPDIAAEWLVQGLDTPSLRALAGHPRNDPWALEELWRATLAELGVRGTSDLSRCLRRLSGLSNRRRDLACVHRSAGVLPVAVK